MLNTGPAGYGLLLAAFSLGAVAAGLLMRFTFAAPAMRTFIIGIFGQAAAHIGIGLSPNMTVAVLTMFATGVGNGWANVAGYAMIQQRMPTAAGGGTIGVLMTTIFLADTLGSITSGGVPSSASAPATFIISGASIGLCFALILALRHRMLTAHSTYEDADAGTPDPVQ